MSQQRYWFSKQQQQQQNTMQALYQYTLFSLGPSILKNVVNVCHGSKLLTSVNVTDT